MDNNQLSIHFVASGSSFASQQMYKLINQLLFVYIVSCHNLFKSGQKVFNVLTFLIMSYCYSRALLLLKRLWPFVVVNEPSSFMFVLFLDHTFFLQSSTKGFLKSSILF